MLSRHPAGAHRRTPSYPTRGNWKLVLENFIECYHCFSGACGILSRHEHVDVVAREAKGRRMLERNRGRLATHRAANVLHLGQSPSCSTARSAARRAPHRGDRQTQSEDGRPVAPLMGQLPQFDGGSAHFVVSLRVSCRAQDHAVMFSFLPKARAHSVE